MQHIPTSAGKNLAVTILTVLVIFGVFAGMAQANDDLAVYAGSVISSNPAYDSLVMIEFPFSINRHQFQFFVPDSSDGGLYARVFAQVDIFDTAGFAVDSVATYFSMRVASQQEADQPDYRVFNQLSLTCPQGLYGARLTVIDVVSKKKGEFFFDRVAAETGPKDHIAIGGSYLAYDIRYVGDDNPNYNNRLVKNGFYVIPNPVSIFTMEDTVLYVYGEIYNLDFTSENVTGYQLEISVFDANDSLYENRGTRIAKKPGESAVIAESFNISNYPVESYSLRMIATDMELSESDTVSLPFHIVSPEAVLKVASAGEGEDQPDYSDISVEDHVRMTKVLLTPEQQAVLNGLSDDGKMSYLKQYWKEHDIDPTTPIVENRLAMIERFRYVNKVFSTNLHRTDGWMTDRGRTYLKYGPWDKRDEHLSPRTSSNSFEVWYYYSVEEGKYFIFEDWTGNEDFRLVHSNVYGEVYSTSWQDLMDQGFIDIPD